MKHLVITILTAFVLIASSCSTSKVVVDQNFPLTDRQKTEATVTHAKIFSQISFLASDEMAGRDTPSDELNIAARYLASQLQQHGVQRLPGMDDYLQSVPLVQVTPPSEGVIRWDGDTARLSEQFVLFDASQMSQEVDFVYVGHGASSDYEGVDVQDKIAVSLCGYEGETNPQTWFFSADEKKKEAKSHGAIGLLEIYNSPQIPFNFLVQYFSSPQMIVDEGDTGDFFHAWMNTDPEKSIKSIKSSPLKGYVEVDDYARDAVETYNVVGTLPGSDPTLKDEYVIYSAHYDHVGLGRPVEADSIYNGARDNAVGTTTVLLAAENIGQYPTRRSALFIFFTGEEKGLLGSQYYADNPLVPLDQVAYCFNSDNAGYNDTSRVTIIGHGRTTASDLISEACSTYGLLAAADEAPEQNLFDRSDNVNFAAKGVPAPTFGLGFKDFDDELLRYYHQPADEPSNLDYNYLFKFFKSYIYSCRKIANTDQRLFWEDGDKYYDAGVELYGSDKR